MRTQRQEQPPRRIACRRTHSRRPVGDVWKPNTTTEQGAVSQLRGPTSFESDRILRILAKPTAPMVALRCKGRRHNERRMTTATYKISITTASGKPHAAYPPGSLWGRLMSNNILHGSDSNSSLVAVVYFESRMHRLICPLIAPSYLLCETKLCQGCELMGQRPCSPHF